jgi:predicted RNA-binding protein with PIN domain
MRLLVDGHNLIGQMRDIRLDDPHDEARLAARLKQYCMRYHHHCTVIFDNGLPGGLSRLSNSNVAVIFAPHGVTADKLLIRRIRTLSDITGIAVVTSDRAIVSEAQRRGVQVIRSGDFAAALAAPIRATLDEDSGADANPVITAAEVAYWLEQFGRSPDDEEDNPGQQR